MQAIKKALTWEEIKFFLMILAPIISALLMYSAINADLAVIEQRLNTIESNHLVHIQEGLERLETRVREIEISNSSIRTLNDK